MSFIFVINVLNLCLMEAPSISTRLIPPHTDNLTQIQYKLLEIMFFPLLISFIAFTEYTMTPETIKIPSKPAHTPFLIAFPKSPIPPSNQ